MHCLQQSQSIGPRLSQSHTSDDVGLQGAYPTQLTLSEPGDVAAPLRASSWVAILRLR